MVIGYDESGHVAYASPSAARFGGFDPDEVVGQALEVLHPEDRPRVHEAMRRLADSGGTSPPLEARMRYHTGDWRWVEMVATNLLDDPAVAGVVTNARDVTERVEAARALGEMNEALRQSNEALNAVLENSPMAIYAFDGDGTILF